LAIWSVIVVERKNIQKNDRRGKGIVGKIHRDRRILNDFYTNFIIRK
jgi:hypothetical protein